MFFLCSLLLQRAQAMSEKRGQQLRHQRASVGRHSQRHGHDTAQAHHQSRKTQEKGENNIFVKGIILK